MEHGHSSWEPGQHGEEDTQPTLHAGRCDQVCAEEGDVQHQAKAPRPSPESVPSGTRDSLLTYWDCGQSCLWLQPFRHQEEAAARNRPGRVPAPPSCLGAQSPSTELTWAVGPEEQSGKCCCHSVGFFGCVGSSLLSRLLFSSCGVHASSLQWLLVVEHRLWVQGPQQLQYRL